MAGTYRLLQGEDGERYDWMSDRITVKLTSEDTGGAFTLVQDTLLPDFHLPAHLHREHAETFYIIEGEVLFRIKDQWQTARVGTVIHVPPGVAHEVRVGEGGHARMLMLYEPAGFEDFLREMRALSPEELEDEETMRRLGEQHDSHPL